MSKTLFSRSTLALTLALTLLAVPTGNMYAQQVVSGGDPQPTGESVRSIPASAVLLIVLAQLGLS